MYVNAKPAELIAILGTIDPISQAAGTVNTGWVLASYFERFMALIQTGVLGAGATLDAKLQQATSAAGAGAKDIAGKAITQIVKATGDNKQALINLAVEELDSNGGFAYVRLQLTVATAASLVGATLIGTNCKNMPASNFNQAGVVQNV